MRTRALVLALGALLSTAAVCATPHLPPPALTTRTITVFGAQAAPSRFASCDVTVTRQNVAVVLTGRTDAGGWGTATWPHTAILNDAGTLDGALNTHVHAVCDGYLPIDVGGVLPARGDVDIFLGGPATATAAQPQVWPVTLTPSTPPMPAAPSRDEILTAQNGGMQGEFFSDATCGTFPWWDPLITTIRAACRPAVYAMKRAYGDKKIIVPLTWSYLEGGLAIDGTGADFSENLPAFHALLVEIIRAGFYVDLRLGADGASNCLIGQARHCDYNDPVGHTYGNGWLVDNFDRIFGALDDLHGFIEWNPGFDGVFYGWDPAWIRSFGAQFRARCTLAEHCFLSLEFNSGHIPTGEGGGSFLPGGDMVDYDGIQAEFDPGEGGVVHNDNIWQITPRLICGDWRRPADEPSGDDETPPCYGSVTNRAGLHYVFSALEPNTYFHVRNRLSRETSKADRDYLASVGWRFIGIPANVLTGGFAR
jgi:hypothetical protein